MKYPLVSIVIVNWNGEKFLEPCFTSLEKVDYPSVEVIFIDNGSVDSSLEIARKSKLKPKIIVNQKNLGFCKANNQGTELARGKYVLFLNNDTEVEPDFLKKLVEEIEKNDRIAVIQPKIIFYYLKLLQSGSSFLTPSGFLMHKGLMKDPNDKKYNQKMEIFSANGACMLVRKKVIEEIGLFDPDFFAYFEESDFCWRVLLAGYLVYYDPEAVVWHKGRLTSGRLASGVSLFLSYRNRICGLIKNLSLKELIKIMPIHIFVCLCCVVAYCAMGKPSFAFSVFKAYWWNIINFKNTLEKREVVQKKIRKIFDSLLMKKYKKIRDLSDFLLFFGNVRKYKG